MVTLAKVGFGHAQALGQAGNVPGVVDTGLGGFDVALGVDDLSITMQRTLQYYISYLNP